MSRICFFRNDSATPDGTSILGLGYSLLELFRHPADHLEGDFALVAVLELFIGIIRNLRLLMSSPLGLHQCEITSF
jgi:hypothetical protein